VQARVKVQVRARHAGAVPGARAKPLRLTRYGPEQVGFLRWRPVLDNTRLKTVFGFVPRHTSAQAFERWAASRCASR